MPGHGTVPAGLTTTRWEAWAAATRLAVRTARALAGEDVPLHMVGYSNGGALALKYALDSLADPKLARPDRLVLISPMVGITSFARFAGVLGWPAAFPSFAKAAWLDVLPEYNPFKYNSFPVNAARQSSQVVRAVEDAFISAADSGALAKLPPVLTFQSVLDATVLDRRGGRQSLYGNLPANGSELVLFERNHRAGVGPMIRPAQANVLPSLLPPAPRKFALTVVGNATEDAATDEARTVAAGATDDADQAARPALSQGPVFAVARGAAVPAAGWAVRQRAGGEREFWRAARHGGGARRTRRADRGRRHAHARELESVLRLHAGTHRSGYSTRGLIRHAKTVSRNIITTNPPNNENVATFS